MSLPQFCDTPDLSLKHSRELTIILILFWDFAPVLYFEFLQI
jgi:hypothetical protein